MYIKKIIITAAAIILSMVAVQAQQTPGGVSNSNYTWKVWLTPDSYDYATGIWTNKITGAGTAGDFFTQTGAGTGAGMRTKPEKRNSGYNFHPAVWFAKSNNGYAPNRLATSGNISIANGQNVTSIFVYKRANSTSYDYLFSFNDGNENGDLVFNTNNSNNLQLYWSGLRGAPVTAYEGIATVDNANNGTNNANSGQAIGYLNGAAANSITTRGQSYNSKWTIGANGSSDNTGRGFEGAIQEIIILHVSGTDSHIDAGDLQKIQTYLCLKYGIQMNNTSNYTVFDGTTDTDIWTRDPTYNSNIFGIGYDVASGLSQMQGVSTSNDLTTVFLGDEIKTLNSQNNGSLANKTYLVLGSNGSTSLLPANIANETPYFNDIIAVPDSLNYQSGTIYKAQLTGPSSLSVNLKVKMDYSYVFVSKDADFIPSQTKIYPVNKNIATIEIDSEYKYIRYAGYSTGPGGVGDKLRLWLSAEDESSLDIEYLDGNNSKLAGFPNLVNNQAPAVRSWRDQMRGITYSGGNEISDNNHRLPVYEPSHLMMNFHPSVRFWSIANSDGSYLVNTSGITNTSVTVQHSDTFKHTAYFVTSNTFSSNPWVYELMFGSSRDNYNGPGYGMQQVSAGNNDNVFGRYRTTTEGRGVIPSFKVGSTSINGYFQSGRSVKFRFNGVADEAHANNGSGNTTIAAGNSSLSQNSYLGRGYQFQRTLMGVMSEAIIFEKGLDADETQRLESYLAIKYGVTLRPSNTSTERFNYALSNGFIFWHGDVADFDPDFGNQATFYNNIAAVIRDDASKLHNVQSHSTAAGSILHMGIAGRKLGNNFELGDLPYDQEVVVWGANTEEGVTDINAEPCADFEHIFKKKWLVCKHTEANRSIEMLVGAENNSLNNIGITEAANNANIRAMYTALSEGNDVCMIVADSPDKLTPGNPAYGDFLAVVPMRYIDGEQQCKYTFTESQVYITFGYKPTRRGCYGEVQFAGTKTYDWNTQWTRRNNNLNGSGPKTIDGIPSSVDLGDGVTVSTKIVYDNGVRADANYPRFVTSPRNALQIQRRSGVVGASTVTTTIKFSTPVVPEFSISGLDGSSRQYDEVIIRASCPKGVAIPTLTYAGSESAANYKIQGNGAVVNRTRSASATDRNGTVNVSFQNGVTELVIEYAIQNRIVGTTAQNIFISPIRMRSVPPAPTINEDGLSFSKQVQNDAIYNCEAAEYTFYIGNVNTEGKYVNFKDVLPDKMKWIAGSVGLDTINAANSSIKFNSYGGTNILEIDSLFVPCTSEIMFKVFAKVDDDAPGDEYANRAAITYERIISNVSSFPTQYSEDRHTLDSLTTFFSIEDPEPLDTIKVYATVNPVAYSPNNEITVSLKVVNPNAQDVTNVYLDLTWDAGFKYVSGSYDSPAGVVSAVFAAGTDTTVLSIARDIDGTQGFDLPADSETIFSFRIIAPTTSNLEHAIDAVTGQTINRIIPATIYYNFVVDSDNPCITENMEASDILEVPFQRSHIIVNQKNTPKTIK